MGVKHHQGSQDGGQFFPEKNPRAPAHFFHPRKKNGMVGKKCPKSYRVPTKQPIFFAPVGSVRFKVRLVAFFIPGYHDPGFCQKNQPIPASFGVEFPPQMVVEIIPFKTRSLLTSNPEKMSNEKFVPLVV